MDTILQPKYKLSWIDYFKNLSIGVSLRSPDPKKSVGCIIIDHDNRIISTGYNGLPPGFPEYIINWGDRDSVKKIIIHAEANALLFSRVNCKGHIMFCTLSPCIECLKLIKVSGINTVYYIEKYKNYDMIESIAKLFEITLIQI